jgi:hypothetical protein
MFTVDLKISNFAVSAKKQTPQTDTPTGYPHPVGVYEHPAFTEISKITLNAVNSGRFYILDYQVITMGVI